jgi:hypothetical protein
LQTDAHSSISTGIRRGQVATLPIVLTPGSRIITLAVRAERADGETSSHLNFAIKSINLQTSISPAMDISINGTPQEIKTGQPIAVYGGGWYSLEGDPDAGFPWRWARSPAEFLIYSPRLQKIQVKASLAAIHDPRGQDGLGNHGTLLITINGSQRQSRDVQVDQPLAIDTTLHEGWNCIRFELEAGNFRPADVQPGNGDGRYLSFAVAGIDISTR